MAASIERARRPAGGWSYAPRGGAPGLLNASSAFIALGAGRHISAPPRRVARSVCTRIRTLWMPASVCAGAWGRVPVETIQRIGQYASPDGPIQPPMRSRIGQRRFSLPSDPNVTRGTGKEGRPPWSPRGQRGSRTHPAVVSGRAAVLAAQPKRGVDWAQACAGRRRSGWNSRMWHVHENPPLSCPCACDLRSPYWTTANNKGRRLLGLNIEIAQ